MRWVNIYGLFKVHDMVHDFLNKAFWGARFSVVHACTKCLWGARKISNFKFFQPCSEGRLCLSFFREGSSTRSFWRLVKCKLSPRSSSAALRQLNLTRKKRPWFFCLYCFINSFANDNEQLETVGNFGNFLSNQPSISQNSLDAAAFQSLVAFWLLHHS